jgi:hypothetical protein
VIDEALDADLDGADPSVLLGRDFLKSVWLTYLGGTLVMFTRPPGDR